MITKFCTISAATSMAGAVSMKSKCPFGYTSGKTNDDADVALLAKNATALYPSDILKCSNAIKKTTSFSKAQYEELSKQLIDLQQKSGDKTKFAACLLRLEGHDLMDLRRKESTWGKGDNKHTGVKREA